MCASILCSHVVRVAQCVFSLIYIFIIQLLFVDCSCVRVLGSSTCFYVGCGFLAWFGYSCACLCLVCARACVRLVLVLRTLSSGLGCGLPVHARASASLVTVGDSTRLVAGWWRVFVCVWF